MSQNQHQTELDPERVVRLLDRSAGQIDARTLSALADARQVALARRTARRTVPVLDTGHHGQREFPHAALQWGGAAVLLAAMLVGGMSYWHHAGEREMSHLDVSILSGDLPLEIFVDY